MILLKILLQAAAQASQADPINNGNVNAQWFFGIIAVLFVGLLSYNLIEVKHAIKALTTKTNAHDTEIALLKQTTDEDEALSKKHNEVIAQIDSNFKRLNQTLVLLTTERSERPRR